MTNPSIQLIKKFGICKTNLATNAGSDNKIVVASSGCMPVGLILNGIYGSTSVIDLAMELENDTKSQSVKYSSYIRHPMTTLRQPAESSSHVFSRVFMKFPQPQGLHGKREQSHTYLTVGASPKL
jgi:hypothetical protein